MAPAWLAAPRAIVSVMRADLRAIPERRGDPSGRPRSHGTATRQRAGMVWPPMLRRPCETGGMNDLAVRLRDAGNALLGLRGPLVAGEPWPLSAAYGTEPEADWGPREVLAHVNEMLPYWTAQLKGVLAGDPGTPAPFGRVATDPDRLARIEVDRRQTTGWLLDAI